MKKLVASTIRILAIDNSLASVKYTFFDWILDVYVYPITARLLFISQYVAAVNG